MSIRQPVDGLHKAALSPGAASIQVSCFSPDPLDWNYHAYSISFHKDGNLQKTHECFELSIRDGFQKAKAQPIEQPVYLPSF